ncbi:unnamed protein product [Anisakis simplex]|uniref:Uncharacterized protein n=1 Tax=Anisakis simplex TaxID=6269 RepID=A0A3P6QGY7_ANISI|nr:unnamed protein product [Anisakis simplex]
MLFVVSTCHAEMIRNCFCSEADSCINQYYKNFMPCIDHCQNRIAALGANFGLIRNCITSFEPSVRNTANCVWRIMLNRRACTNGQARMVEKHYDAGMKIAFMAELRKVANRAGITAESMGGLVSGGKKVVSCMRKCMNKSSGGCMHDTNTCQLILPPENEFIQMIKQCGIQNGIDTAGFQRFCQCVAASGISRLFNFCPRIQIYK